MKLDIFAILVLTICASCRAGDTKYMRASIEQHFSKTRHHTAGMAYKMAAKQFIHDEFRRFGLDTEYQNFDEINIAQTPFTNVIGILKGNNFGTVDDKIVGVGAHYDTVATSPGVDDNGAGMAAMLEAARQLSKPRYQRNNTVLFVAFDIEEQGLIGSRHFIDEWLNPWLSRNYGATTVTDLRPYGVIVLDTMMEYNTSANSQLLPVPLDVLQNVFPTAAQEIAARDFAGDFLALIYRRGADARDSILAAAFKHAWTGANRTEFKIEPFPLPVEDVTTLKHQGFDDFLRSDHANFWSADIPGIYITDSANFRGDMEQCYHHACDDLEVMLNDDNIRFLEKTADTIAATVNTLSVPLTDCGLLASPVNGVVDLPATTVGETATYTCNPGYEATGTTSRVCLGSGTWSGSGPTCSLLDTSGSAAATPSILAVILTGIIACLHRTERCC